jgi:hypothetical protein
LAFELGLASEVPADAGGERLHFGELEPLVQLMQDTQPAELLPILVGKLRAGTTLQTLVAAGALANARTFGGQDYVGYHAFMALVPALEMAPEVPLAALPVLKVLFRNTDRMRQVGGGQRETLSAVESAQGTPDAAAIRSAFLARDLQAAERAFSPYANEPAQAAWSALQHSVLFDAIDVHRTVLTWRAWDMLRLCGPEHAHTLLRQSLRFCVDRERMRVQRRDPEPPLRALLPALLEARELPLARGHERRLEDAQLEQLANTVFASNREDAARAVAAALAEGVSGEDIGEALSLAGTQLLLNDGGRDQAAEGKPVGSVHGASVGVHASDAAAAWRQIARISDPFGRAAALIVGAYHTAGQSEYVGRLPLSYEDQLEALRREVPAQQTLDAVAQAIEQSDQRAACAAVAHHVTAGGSAAELFSLLVEYATTQDGSLHAEKYYRTAREVYEGARPAFRARHLIALGRVTASEYGFPAPGVEEARALLLG